MAQSSRFARGRPDATSQRWTQQSAWDSRWGVDFVSASVLHDIGSSRSTGCPRGCDAGLVEAISYTTNRDTAGAEVGCGGKQSTIGVTWNLCPVDFLHSRTVPLLFRTFPSMQHTGENRFFLGTAVHKLLENITNRRVSHLACWRENPTPPAARRYASTHSCRSPTPVHANPAEHNPRIWRVLHRKPTINVGAIAGRVERR